MMCQLIPVVLTEVPPCKWTKLALKLSPIRVVAIDSTKGVPMLPQGERLVITVS
jgi:hypothetical protein